MVIEKPYLVMITGAAPGMGKTTLARELARTRGAKLLEGEALIFHRPEFEEVGACFRRGDQPDALQIEHAYTRLVNTVQQTRAVHVIDGSFVDLAEDLRWAMASEVELHQHSRRMRHVLRPVLTVTLFVDGDISEGIRRREAERGRQWFLTYDVPGPGEPWETTRERIETYFTTRRHRVRRALEAGNWPLSVLDGNRAPHEVLDAAQASCKSARGR